MGGDLKIEIKNKDGDMVSFEMKQCEECEFWYETGFAPDDERSACGECHRYPPFSANMDDKQWPMTSCFECCGDHKKRR